MPQWPALGCSGDWRTVQAVLLGALGGGSGGVASRAPPRRFPRPAHGSPNWAQAGVIPALEIGDRILGVRVTGQRSKNCWGAGGHVRVQLPESRGTGWEAAGWCPGWKGATRRPFRPESHLNSSQKLTGAPPPPPRRCGLGGVLLAAPPGTVRAVSHRPARSGSQSKGSNGVDTNS